jgi:AcrR family transcriptional regulator
MSEQEENLDEYPAARRLHRRGAATRDTIIRAAERLFAARGIDGVSIRDITREAEVDIALLNYHFGNKEGLFEAVIGPRISEVAVDRERRLKALPQNFTLEHLVAAFYRPVHERMRSGDPTWKHYAEIVAQVGSAERYSQFRRKYFDEIAERFVDHLALLYPDADRRVLYWCYAFLTAGMGQILTGSDRLALLTNGACDTRDLDTAFAELHHFTVSGITGLAAVGLQSYRE